MAEGGDVEEECRALQAEEREVLEAIYGESYQLIEEKHGEADGTPRACSIRIDLSESELPEAAVFFHLPVTYPLLEPPVVQVEEESGRLTEEMKSDIAEQMMAAYEEMKGEVMVFRWMELVKDYIAENVSVPEEDEHVALHREGEIGEEDETRRQVKDVQQMEEETEQTKDQERSASGLSSLTLPEIIHGEPFTDRKSTFQAHLARVHSMEEVQLVMRELLSDRKIARATHNIMAYRFFDAGRNILMKDNDDDGETAAGSRMAHVMEIMDVRDVIVVVSRWYGGIQLGPDRFKHINNCCRKILEDCGFTEQAGPAGKKGKAKSKGR